jgi:recombination associated protein RdgC
MFKNALLYRIDQWTPPPLDEVEDRLATSRFTACGATQPESAGWLQPRGDKEGALIENIGGQLVLRLGVERKAVPASVVKAELEARLDRIEAETGRRPKGKIAKELKEEIVQDLLPRAFPKRSATLVWIDVRAGFVVIDAASTAKADRVVTMLVELLGGGIRLSLAQSTISPATAMAEWLTSKEAPAGFTVDRECELKQPDSEKATVKYARHTLDIDEVGQHIVQGKLPTQLAMTWSSRVSFVLSDAMTIKKLKLLDVVLEGASTATKDEDHFDADVALVTGELQQLIPALIEALGGELNRDAVTGAAAPAPQPLAA